MVTPIQDMRKLHFLLSANNHIVRTPPPHQTQAQVQISISRLEVDGPSRHPHNRCGRKVVLWRLFQTVKHCRL